MTYNLYVDLAFGWACIINLVLLYVSERLLGNAVSLRRIIPEALLISGICTAEYVMFYSYSPILQNTLYVLTYFLLLYLLHSSGTSLLLTYAVYVLTSFFIALVLLLLSYSLKKGILQTGTLTFCLAAFFPAVYIIYSYAVKRVAYRSCIHCIEIDIHGNKFVTRAYMDTGNSLSDLSGRDVIITDLVYAAFLLGKAYKELFDTYQKKKTFDYMKANSISDIIFYPVPYRTLSSTFCTMPGFTADSVLYPGTGRLYRNITIAISQNQLTLKEDARVLSNHNLKP
jgi:hypothetical protein